MPETISFNCPHCSIELDVPAELAGVSGPCPNCHVTIYAPLKEPPPASLQHSSPETIQSAAPSAAGTVDPPIIADKDQINPITADPQQSAPTDPSTGQPSNNSRHTLKNALIGFLSVTILAAATWGAAKLIEKSKEKNSDQMISPAERMAPDISPINITSKTKSEVLINDDGKVTEGDAVFPIENTVEPPAIDLSSLPGAFIDPPVTPGSVVDKNRAGHLELLEDSPKPPATKFVPQSENEKMMVECRKLITDFLVADTLEERLPLIFSERVPDAEMAETLSDTVLNGPIEIAKTITNSPLIYYGYEGPNANGIAQQYFLLTLAPLGDEKKLRYITVHMANHHEGKYRINADAFLFSAENKLEHFVNNPKAEPLMAYLFLERCHFSFDTDVKEPPSGTFCVRLLSGPVDQSSTTAIVSAIKKTGAVLDPVVKWGVPPRAVIVELKHESTPSGGKYISIDRVLKLNWLQSYEVTSTSGG